MILHLIGQIGAAGGTGYAVEYAGSAIRDMEVEGRLTVCNLSIELGAKIGMVAPDDKTFEFLEGPPLRAQGRAVGPGRRRLALAGQRCRRGVRRRGDKST